MHKIFFVNLCLAFNLLAMDPPSSIEENLLRQTQAFQRKRQEAKTTGSIDMTDEAVADELVKGIMASVLAEETITSLALFVTGSEGVRQIAIKLPEIKVLKKLKIRGYDINRKSMLALAEAIGKNRSLEDLVINISNLNNEALSDFSTALQTHPKLCSAGFQGNFDLIGIRDAALSLCYAQAPDLNVLKLFTISTLPKSFETTLPDALNKKTIEKGIVLNKILRRKSTGSPNKSGKQRVKKRSSNPDA